MGQIMRWGRTAVAVSVGADAATYSAGEAASHVGGIATIQSVATKPGRGERLQHIFNPALVRLFVDSVWLHKYWDCHRLPDRCFHIDGRQFHVCARCTGLIVGVPFSLLLIPIRQFMPIIFYFFMTAFLIDGVTQLLKLRTSNNRLRFATGFGTAATFLPSALALLGYL
jgi:uncharacterized membrane protein